MREDKAIAISGSTLRRQCERLYNLLFSSPAICLLGLAFLYFALFGRYRAYEIDNPWYLSFSHNYWVDHFTGDRFLNGVFPDGMGGTVVFGRLAALFQGVALHQLRWRQDAALWFSLSLVIAGLALWYCFLRRSGWNVAMSNAVILALGLSEPFVSMANRFRFEPVSFLLFSAAFFLVAAQRSTLAIIVSFVAIETEPAAAIILGSVLLYLARTGRSPGKLVLQTLLGAGCFALLYLSLHPDIASVLQHTDWNRGAGQRQIGGFLRAYFFERRRHLPELFLFIGVSLFYFHDYVRTSVLVRRMAEVTVLVCVFSFVMNWPTPAYMIFFFPPALVVAGGLVETRWKKAWLLPAVMAVLMVPQYCAVAYLNWGESYRTRDFMAVDALIVRSEQRLGLDDSRTEIMGDYSLWFSHPAHYRALAKPTLGEIPNEDLFLCFEKPIRPASMVDQIVRYCGDVRARAIVREIDRMTVRGHLLHVLAPERLR